MKTQVLQKDSKTKVLPKQSSPPQSQTVAFTYLIL